MNAETFLAIEIGGTKLQLVLGDAEGIISRRARLPIDPGAGGVGIRKQIVDNLGALTEGVQIKAGGVGFGGPVDWRSGKICCSHQVKGWDNFELGAWLADLIQAPVAVDNDANVAAFGEASRGAGVGFDPVFYATLGSGVGGGLVYQGHIYHGATPGEMEIGHVRLDKSGVIVEQRCSGWAVDRRIRAAIQAQPESVLAGLARGAGGTESKHLAAALGRSDPLAQKILSEIADDLAFGLSHVVHLLHPRVVVLGGGLSLVGEPLRAGVAGAMPQYIMEAFHPGPEIRLAALGEDVVLVGGLLLAQTAQTAK